MQGCVDSHLATIRILAHNVRRVIFFGGDAPKIYWAID
jgi:hypothetical protein